MKNKTLRRVVVTGLGVVAPNGIGQEAFWQATSRGISGIRHLQHPDNTQGWVAGTPMDFVAEQYVGRKLVHRTDRMTHLAFAAIQEAIEDARLDLRQENPRRVGAVIANTMGGVDYVIKQLQTLYTRGPRFVSAYTAIAWLSVATVGQAAIQYSIQGYCKTPVNDSVGGLDAMGTAYSAIRRGAADIIIAGGSEAFLHPFFIRVLALHGHCTLNDDPQSYRPFDQRAQGLALAEGAGICILEEYEHALERGAPIYGEIVGYGQTNDAHGLHVPPADGKYYARAICLAMREASLEAEDIAYISLDGRALPSADQGEVSALRIALGNSMKAIPASVPRTMLGHSYAAAGAIDTITALLALKYGLIPPTIHCEELDPRYELDMVRDEPRRLYKTSAERKPGAVLIGGRGVGGVNVALVVKKAERDERAS